MSRTFIAIPVPSPVRNELAACAAAMARGWPEGSVCWTPADNIHLTLRFLGDTEPEQLSSLKDGLDGIGVGAGRFSLNLAGAGCFPDPRRPRVIWAGLGDSEERLPPLQRGVEKLAQGLGWPPEEREFRAHLTLGRVRQQKPVARPSPDWLVEPVSLLFAVDSVELIESRLHPTGARYRTLHQVELVS